MEKLIRSLHHLTATVGDAQEDLEFYAGTLGMRLVKKTVNFDNHDVYHFYYGDESGTPGTLMTTFPYAGHGVPHGKHGAGQITRTAFSVPRGSLDAWRSRLGERGVDVTDSGERFGDPVIAFEDPSGLVIELVANEEDDRTPWTGDLAADVAIRGLDGASLSIREPGPSVAFLTDVLGWEVTDEEEGRTRLAVDGDRPGHRLDIVEAADAPEAVNGIGTVHHIAMAVEDAEAQLDVRDELVGHGLRVTPVLDRQYFRSIYFREPGGVLFEVATIPPGFTVDEEIEELGSGLRLPPWEESNREAIEPRLASVTY